MTTTVDAAAGVDADLARLVDTLGGISDGDLHRASFGGGWTVAQVSRTSACRTLVWLGDLRRLEATIPSCGSSSARRSATTRSATRRPRSRSRWPASPPPAAPSRPACRRWPPSCSPARVEIPDLGTMTVEEWTPIIIGHLTSHVEQALDILRNRGVL